MPASVLAMTLPRQGTRWLIGAIVAIGWSIRALPLALHGLVRYPIDYDQGVNFSAAAVLIRGSWLYEDVVFVHPPGLPYALTFVSWLPAELGFGLSRLLMTIVGAINILLICQIALRCAGLLSAIVAGSLYALHPAVVAAERGVFLEPLLIMFCLAAGAKWLGADQESSTGSRAAWLSGVLLGCAAVVKLWAVLVVLACLASSRRGHGWSDAGRLFAGAVAAFAILLLPVALRSPISFFKQVIVFQMKRPADGPSDAVDRFRQIFLESASVVPTLCVAVAIGVLVLTGGWTRLARFCLTWFVVTAGSFLLAPSYYPNYNAFLAPSAALAAAVGVERLQFALKGHRPQLKTWTTTLAVIAASVSGAVLMRALLGGAQLSPQRADAHDVALVRRFDGCLLSFDPGQLISRGSLPDPRCVGTLAVDPYGAQLLAVVESGRPYSSAREAFTDPASQRTVVQALDRSGGVILDARGQVQLADARRRLEAQFEPDTTVGPGVDLWVRKRDRIKPVGRRRRRTGRTEVGGLPPADAAGARPSDPTSGATDRCEDAGPARSS